MVKVEWIYWHSCLICGKNKWDALHHVVSPSIQGYKEGKHNESILNSCPIHNFGCHIGNEAHLSKFVGTILQNVLNTLDEMGYALGENDKEFLKVYGDLYERYI